MLKVGLSVNEQLFHKEHVAAMKQALMDAGYQGVWMYELGLLLSHTHRHTGRGAILMEVIQNV